MVVPMAFWMERDHLLLYLDFEMSLEILLYSEERRDKLVVRMLRGDFFKLADDDGLFLDGSFDLSYEGGVCN